MITVRAWPARSSTALQAGNLVRERYARVGQKPSS